MSTSRVVPFERYEKLRQRAESAEVAFRTMAEQKEYFRQIWESAEAELAALRVPCVWTLDDDNWFLTGCDRAYSEPAAFCPGCGHPIQVTE